MVMALPVVCLRIVAFRCKYRVTYFCLYRPLVYFENSFLISFFPFRNSYNLY